jgi:DNA-directed RNA polymerase specialized sigma24 family protein
VFQDRILRYIKRHGRGFLDTHDRMVAYQETIIGMLVRARRPDFEPCRSLRMVLSIAKYKTIDMLRERGHRINLDEDAILEAVAADTKGSEIYLQWRLHVFPAELRELREILFEFIATLPERQRVVAQCFVDNYEDFRARDTYKPLADAVGAITGVTESVADVKNVWRYVRVRIIEELQGRGYTYIRVE